MVTSATDKTVRVWDLTERPFQQLRGPLGPALDVVFRGTGQDVFTLHSDGVRLWGGPGNVKHTWLLHEGVIRAGRLAPEATTVLAETEQGLQHWSLREQRLRALPVPWGKQFRLIDAEFSAASNRVALVGASNGVAVYSLVDSGRLEWRGGGQGIVDVSFDARGTRLASARADGTVTLYGARGERVGRFNAGKRISAVALSPDGERFVIGGTDGTVELVDAFGKQLGLMAGLSGRVLRLCFSTDGSMIAASGAGGMVRVWDLTGGLLTEFDNPAGSKQREVYGPPDTNPFLYALALGGAPIVFRLDAGGLAAGGDDGVIRLWPIRDADWLIKQARRWLGKSIGPGRH